MRAADVEQTALDTVSAVRRYTRTPPSGIVALCEAVGYLTDAAIGGDIVECGVWRGGRMLAAARTLLERGDLSRTLWLYDTFEAMSEATAADRRAAVSLPAVQRTVSRSGYPTENMRYVVGPVVETVPDDVPDSIALLRIDAAAYEPAQHQLTHLVRRMTTGAVVIIDGYRQPGGVAQAVEDYIRTARPPMFLRRIDGESRIGVVAAPMPQPKPKRRVARDLAPATAAR